MLITLTTDFGLDDPFVAMMKGVILGRSPQSRLVDICHTIPPQDVEAASLVLQMAAPSFPGATIHVAVVDPGVGTSRRIICLAAHDQLFLAPDNGLLTPFLSESGRAFELSNEEFFLQPVSATFHGRDILAPVAAALARGLDPQELGPAVPVSGLVHLPLPRPIREKGQLRGQCLRADHFGNMATNISKKELASFLGPDEIPVIRLAGTTIIGLSPSYGQKQAGALALLNSSDHLEISVSHGNASRELALCPGTPVIVTKKG